VKNSVDIIVTKHHSDYKITNKWNATGGQFSCL